MQVSCGLLMFVRTPLRVLLAHPGGPCWQGNFVRELEERLC